MSAFELRVEIGCGERWDLIEMLVDTGSLYTWLPRPILDNLRIQPEFQQEFETSDGRLIVRDMAVARARLDNRTMSTLVVFGDAGSAPLLGKLTLTEFGLEVDEVNRRLIRVPGLAVGVVISR